MNPPSTRQRASRCPRDVPDLRARRRVQARRRALLDALGQPTLTVGLQPTPCPTATVKAQGLHRHEPHRRTDRSNENGLAGFAGHIADTLGEVTTDVFGNPLCTSTWRTPSETQILGRRCDAPVRSPTRVELPQRRRRHPDDPAPGHEPIHPVGHTPRTARTGSRPRRSRATTTGTPGSWKARPGTTPSSPSPASPSRASSSASCAHARPTTAQPCTPAYGATSLTVGTGQIDGVVDAVKTYTPPTGGIFDLWDNGTRRHQGRQAHRPAVALA